jgi:hypothetical protein
MRGRGTRFAVAVLSLATVGVATLAVHRMLERDDPLVGLDGNDMSRGPLRQLVIPPDLILGRVKHAPNIDVELPDVIVGRERVSVCGRPVAVGDAGALRAALVSGEALSRTAGEGRRAANFVVDARLPYANLAWTLVAAEDEVAELHFVVARDDGSIGALPALRRGTPCCRLNVVPDGGGLGVSQGWYDVPALVSDFREVTVLQRALSDGASADVDAALDAFRDAGPVAACSPTLRLVDGYAPEVDPRSDSSFADIVTALEAADRLLGGASLGPLP